MSFVLRRFARRNLLALAVLAVVGGLSTPAFSLTWTVDRNSPACTDSGPGDAITPFCTIKKAGQLAIPGDEVVVRPGTYREQVTPPASGSPGLPITYRTSAPGVILLGTDDLSDAAGWATTATTAWSRAFAPSSPPTQVFVDGARLALATGPATTFPGSFFYDAVVGVLYVDIGGLNPAVGHVVEAGARTYGFNLVSRSHVVVDGFDIRRQNSAGVRFATSSSNLTVRNNIVSNTGSYGILSDAGVGPILIEANTVSFAASVGIRLLNSTGVTVRGNDSHSNLNHGIALQGSSNNLIEGNTSYLNARPKVRAANGLDVNAVSLNNVVRDNIFYSNQDSGCQVYNGSTGNLVVRNISYANGDHGFDTNQSTGTRYISNTSYGNFKDGFSVEGLATGTTLRNNIAMNNGLTTGEFDLYVDAGSAPGFSSNYDILYKSSPGNVVKFNLVLYATLNAFAAGTGQELQGIGADPVFTNAAAGNFMVKIGPAVDSADSGASGFEMPDLQGVDPQDIPGVVDTGAGPVSYADRGALEHIDLPPVAVLQVKPSSGKVPFSVTASASGSTDDDGIVSYTFNFGNGVVVGPQAGSSASYTYTVVGHYTVTVTVRDTGGFTASDSKQINARKP